MTTALTASCSPAEAVNAVAILVYGAAINLDDISHEQAFLSASSLLLALGIEPDIDPGNHTAAAELVRGFMLEDATRTTTRSRRSL